MSSRRIERINVALQREIAAALFRLPGLVDIDLAAVTVVSVSAAADLRTAQVRLSIRGAPQQRSAWFAGLVGQRKALQEIIARNLRLKYTPHLVLRLDASIAKGDHVLAILHELEAAQAKNDVTDA